MYISGSSSTSQVQSGFELPQMRRREQGKAAQLSGDTVSFSSEALELLARMQAAKQEAGAETSPDVATETAFRDLADAEKTVPAPSASASNTSQGNAGEGEMSGGDAGEGSGNAPGSAPAGGGGGADSSTDIDGQIEKIKGQIKQLASSMQNILQAPLPEDQKSAQSAPVEQKIQALEGQIQGLEAQKAEQAAASAKG